MNSKQTVKFDGTFGPIEITCQPSPKGGYIARFASGANAEGETREAALIELYTTYATGLALKDLTNNGIPWEFPKPAQDKK